MQDFAVGGHYPCSYVSVIRKSESFYHIFTAKVKPETFCFYFFLDTLKVIAT